MTANINNPIIDDFIKYFKNKETGDPTQCSPEHRRSFLCVSEHQKGGVNWKRVLDPTLGLLSTLLEMTRDNAMEDIKIFAISDVIKTFSFLPGHPQVDEVYVQHPMDLQRYLPARNYLRLLYEEKVNEFRLVLGELAIKRIRARWIRGAKFFWGFGGEIKQDKDRMAGNIGGEANWESNTEIYEVYDPTHAPRQPEGSEYRWLSHEVTWQGLVKSRLSHGLKQTTLSFEFAGRTALGVEIATIIDAVNAKVRFDDSYASETKWEINLDFS